MSRLLDTNICIALMNRTSAVARRHFSESTTLRIPLYISTIVIHELEFGVANSHPARRPENIERLGIFLAKTNLISLSFSESDAKAAAEIRAQLRRLGKPIGAYDLLLAGQALANDLTLVTANEAEFSRVKKLKWTNWLK